MIEGKEKEKNLLKKREILRSVIVCRRVIPYSLPMH